MNYAFKYIMSNGGICSASAYPYLGYDNVSKKVMTCFRKFLVWLMDWSKGLDYRLNSSY